MVEIISHLTWTIFVKKIHPFLLRKSFHLVRVEWRTLTSMDRLALRYMDKKTNTTSFCRRQQQWTSFKSGVGTNRLWLQYLPYRAQCNEHDKKWPMSWLRFVTLKYRNSRKTVWLWHKYELICSKFIAYYYRKPHFGWVIYMKAIFKFKPSRTKFRTYWPKYNRRLST